MTEMKTLTINGVTYEIVDHQARQDIASLTPDDIGAVSREEWEANLLVNASVE